MAYGVLWAVVVLGVASLVTCPWVYMRLLLQHSLLDDDLAEHCYEPSRGMEAWDTCRTTGKSAFAPMDDFPTGGSQVLSDGYGADPAILNNNTMLLQLLNSASECCGSSVLSHTDHHFDPQGATILGLLSTSHYAVHTWPERNAFTLDVYFCTPEARQQVLRFAEIICEAVKASKCCYRIVRRPLL
eukprot:TRINITY_DN15469_c0_g1_i1.p1 TRINITY_DN15469_c0_g1~~TRINITY_DN15469_c0_g1_i1.p1  ORF type:complete len:204 (+),score=53.62 TRINITY_DN15469_c0_g1_i1:56-613(+)